MEKNLRKVQLTRPCSLLLLDVYQLSAIISYVGASAWHDIDEHGGQCRISLTHIAIYKIMTFYINFHFEIGTKTI